MSRLKLLHGRAGSEFFFFHPLLPIYIIHCFQEFKVSATAADLLEIEVRNKSTRPTASKFLGKLVFPLSKIIESCGFNRLVISSHLIGTSIIYIFVFCFVCCCFFMNKTRLTEIATIFLYLKLGLKA